MMRSGVCLSDVYLMMRV